MGKHTLFKVKVAGVEAEVLQLETTTDNVPSASVPGPYAPVLGVVFSFPAGSLSGATEQAGGASACLSL